MKKYSGVRKEKETLKEEIQAMGPTRSKMLETMEEIIDTSTSLQSATNAGNRVTSKRIVEWVLDNAIDAEARNTKLKIAPDHHLNIQTMNKMVQVKKQWSWKLLPRSPTQPSSKWKGVCNVKR